MPPKKYITLEAIHLAQSTQEPLNLLGKLGYSIKNEIGFAPTDLEATRIILFDLEEVGLARWHSLARNLLSRGGNYLIIATQDRHCVAFVNPRRDGNRVRIRKPVVDIRRPKRHELDVPKGLVVIGQGPEVSYRSQCEAFN